MGSCNPNPVVGKWKGFVFKMIELEDIPKILVHLREHFLYQAFYRIGYTDESGSKDLVDAFEKVLKDGNNLSFYAEDEKTGKVAGCRVITIEKPGEELSKTKTDMKDRICKGLMKFYYEAMADCKIKERYNVDSYPHLFGISVDSEFQRQGLAIEIYKRANAMLKEKGHKLSVVSFISPYSRAAGAHNGFKQLLKINLVDIKDCEGNPLYAQADPANFIDFGVFEL